MPPIGFAVSLPEHVERFDPIRRRIAGSGFVLVPGRWPGRVDSRALTRQAVRAAGAPFAWEEPYAELDLVLFHGECTPAKLTPFLRQSTGLLRWYDGHGSGGPVADLPGFVSAPGWVESTSCPVVGDPRLESGRDEGASGRARAALGLSDADRPLLVLAFERPLSWPWAESIARLRSEFDLVVSPSSRARLINPRSSRRLTGPGIHFGAGAAFADLLAAAQLCLTDSPAVAWDALSLATPAVCLRDGGPVLGASGRNVLDGLVQVDWPDHLPAVVAETLRAPLLEPTRAFRALPRLGRPSHTIAQALLGSYASIVSGSR